MPARSASPASASRGGPATARLRREKLGFVFQAFHVLQHLTLEQNVRVPLLLLRRDDPRRARWGGITSSWSATTGR